jgi:hypothetical protein
MLCMGRAPFRASILVFLVGVSVHPSICRAQSRDVNSTHACMFRGTPEGPEDEFVAALAVRGNAVAGCLIAEVSGKDSGSTRAQSAMTLVQAMAIANPPLDLATAQRARDVVVKALRDRSVEVRVATVTALAEFGDESMVPALQLVAKSDPVLSLRDYTAGAIARMRKRLTALRPQDVAAARR